MFVLQIHSVTFYNPSTQTKPRNVFLDISNENQPSRRYFVGRFSTSSTKSCESIVHVSKTPITVHLSYGPLMYHDLGPQTIYDFLYEDISHLGQKKFLTFGRRGPLYHVCYSISPVKYSYGFALSKISCLKQITSGKDELYAEVEFNNSPQSIGSGPTNKYHLGSFVSHDMTEIHSVHNLTFSTLVNFVITFYVKTKFAEYILGTLKFTPAHELNAPSDQSVLKRKHSIASNSNTTGSSNSLFHRGGSLSSSSTQHNQPPPSPQLNQSNPPSMSVGQHTPSDSGVIDDRMTGLTAILNQPSEIPKQDYSGRPVSQNEEVIPSPLNQAASDKKINREKGGLLFYRATSDDKVHTFLQDDYSTTKRITLSSPEGNGSYEFVFSLNKTDFMLTSQAHNQSDGDDIDSSNNRTEKHPTMRHSAPSLSEKRSEHLHHHHHHTGLNTSEEAPTEISNNTFSLITENNEVEVLIDGLQTFRRYFESMMNAEHSISILAWELSFSFGLVLTKNVKSGLPSLASDQAKWITLEDVLLSKAMSGVNVRIIVWRHELLSHLTRFLYLGEVTIEREVAKLERRCKKLSIPCKVFNTTTDDMSSIDQSYIDEYSTNVDGGITIVIAGNPQGILSSHHEKLVLVDAECPDHCIAFTGGFDIARGRYDQPLHQIPRPYLLNTLLNSPTTEQQKRQQSTKPPRYSGSNIQPVLRQIRFLWHDIQISLRGDSAQYLKLHFNQRWIHAFTQNVLLTRSKTIPKDIILKPCTKVHQPLSSIVVEHNDPAPLYKQCAVRLFRTWKGVLDNNLLFDDYGKMILNAKEFLYVEHQYPFQNFTLTYYMCEALKANPKLHILIVTPVKTDLPSGLVGELFDWSQDHIIRHLHLIYSVAPDRVGIYGLVRQDEESNRLKPIYIHSKLILVDDQLFNVGSTNMDNMSFFHSSELTASIVDPKLARETRVRLAKEHLGDHYTNAIENSFLEMFNAFKKISDLNYERLRYKRLMIGRPVALAPIDKYEFLLKKIYYPNKFAKILYKLGVDTDEWIGKVVNPSIWLQKFKPKL
ncbi:phospholipase D [Heterostelium album PN500]|uniref:phospholipase D n=1 Tax=Heterostelium pallidum (strain ATCC 26659 / Pp 5 / PN500) TaxID=670386 RepID=D3BB21_HETP5|nr:phospholipase D [Heterostelium album PN500]EFA81758.1 phospholipase D [Heterostelium album PN500]|eukprot:XP_020433875.1 phospholipase D [Heterostelium album PN500]